MKILLVEDDIVSRSIMMKLLSVYGDIEIAQNGEKALNMFFKAFEEKAPYNLVSLDIMMPGKDGQQVLKEIREYEYSKGIMGNDGVKIIMTTALDDKKNILEAFKSQCEAYLTKPINVKKLHEELKKLGFPKKA
ncbi:MAG: response regulator [Proteobacteria bacterium]|nr:response regulator [Pseudomonadota bacterium]